MVGGGCCGREAADLTRDEPAELLIGVLLFETLRLKFTGDDLVCLALFLETIRAELERFILDNSCTALCLSLSMRFISISFVFLILKINRF